MRNPYQCGHPGCVATFASRVGYRQHLNRHAGIYQYHCPYCNKGLNGTKDIKHHLKSTHTGMFGFHCIHCTKECASVHVLKYHLDNNACRGPETEERELQAKVDTDNS